MATAFQDVAKAIKPSVVSVRSVQRIEARERNIPLPFRDRGPFGEDFMQRFFGRGTPEPEEFVRRGLGTGVIVSPDGYIVTNNHVVRDASDVSVVLSDSRTYSAKVVGTDEKTDVAVLKVEASDLMPAELGDSDALSVGEWVLAIGSPFGLSQTVTAGIISATGRANVGIADYEDFIQTDAAINPGNSGGPLVNLEGKVIGINTAIATRTGGYQGIGFAIPAKMVRQIMQSIVKEGKVVRGWLGVSIQNLNEGLSRSFQFEGKSGVLVGDVVPDGPADRAGVKAGDIITRLDGREVTDMNQLRNTVAAIKPGTKVSLEVFREGQTRTVSVAVGELEGSAVAAAPNGGATNDLGLTVQSLTPEIAEQLGLRADERGVVVTRVQPASPAETAGLMTGDVIVAVGDKQISNERDFQAALAHADLAKGVRLRCKTDGTLRFVFLKR
ncbi:MAG: DegQ family serine endoprotease [Phycisphaerae bacterium]